jgi:hypothetical protein
VEISKPDFEEETSLLQLKQSLNKRSPLTEAAETEMKKQSSKYLVKEQLLKAFLTRL